MPQFEKAQSPVNPGTHRESSRSFDGIAGNGNSGGQIHNELTDAPKLLTASKARCRKATMTRIEKSKDPYELSADENEAPAAAFGSSLASSATTVSIGKKRKFFSTQRESSSKRTALIGFELLRQKLAVKSGGRRRALSAANRISSSRAPPMSESERARIAATTIWLPIPNRQYASTPNRQHPHRLQPSPLPLPSPDRRSEILTGNPAVRLSSLSALASPLDSRTVQADIAPLESTAVMPREGSTHDALPLADISNIAPRPPSLSFDRVGDRAYGETRRISFAQPLSPMPKRSSGSRAGSSNLSTSGSKGPSRHSHNEDASNYEEWLEKFNFQLKPYEDFDLTVD
ncbi:unnamed protein product [Hydatigera taeniaeformis]|uniref:Similar to n=1 Tax=Hydatigena taeniaeformis TaxID=6205 RepID=A0A0R3X9U8_HYDTA|nr:unnamed protein product [Hydatigera taeniaeformis]